MIPESDIDLQICEVNVSKHSEAVQLLDALSENLKNFSWVMNTNNVFKARIPVLKIEVDTTIKFNSQTFPDASKLTPEFLQETNSLVGTPQRRIMVDITVELPEVSGSSTTDFVCERLDVHPNLFPLVLILKYFLNSINLTNPYFGGLSSYSISILVIAWLEKENRPKSENIYGLFKEMIRFYSKDFNP